MLIRLLRRYLAPYRRIMLYVVVLQTLQTIAALYLPRLLTRIIDRGVARNDHGYIWAVGGWMLLLSLVQMVFTVGAIYYGSRVANGLGRDVRAGLFHQVMAYSAREVGQIGAPSLITRITNDVQQVQMLVQITCAMAITAPITLIGGTILALQADTGLSEILLVCVPFLMLATGTVITRMVPKFRLMQTRIDHINQVLREQITGIRVVRAFVREPQERQRFDRANDDLTETSVQAGRLMAFMFPTVSIVLNLSSVAVVWIGADRIREGSTTVGSLVGFLSYIAQILMSIMMASFVAAIIPRASACADRICEVLDTETSVTIADEAVTSPPGRGVLELRDVGFRYPGAEEPVLAGVTLTSGPGETTAIIGSTGSGKTTLINLVARLADATTGSVVVDGVDVRRFDPDALTDRIGLVPQKPYLFSGTVASNLRYGKPDATDDELWEALRIAQATDFVRAMEGGLEAKVAQGGSNLSGGQRQRLAIARALVRKPEIYLFDDSFSALDLATDARLRAALAPTVREATVLVVAQRVSTIASADRILVLEDGEPVGLGTHDELVATCPTYAEIVNSQLGLDDEDEESGADADVTPTGAATTRAGGAS